MAVSASKVGSFFVGKYYLVLGEDPDHAYQFYNESSTMIRVDGDSIETASATLQIHTLIMSLNFTAIEIKTINSTESWNGGVMVMVTGFAKTEEYIPRRKFVQTFFLAPQEQGFFVLNDIFHFIDDDTIDQPLAHISSEIKFDTKTDAASLAREPPASNYASEEEARDYVDSAYLEDDPVDKYSIPEQHQCSVPEQHLHSVLEQQYSLQDQQRHNIPEQHQQQEFEEETAAEEAPTEGSALVENVYTMPAAYMEDPTEEAPKKTYASILQVARGQSTPSVGTQPSSQKIAPTYSEWDYPPQQPNIQHSNVPLTSVTESRIDTAEESLSLEEGELKSVYVRNLPSTVTTAEIEQEFMNFGRIRPDGVFIKLRKEIGVCYAFVEFEDLIGVQNAIQASPIHLAGRQVYIEERRANNSGASRGVGGGRRNTLTGRGRGRVGYQTEAPRGRR